MLDRLALFPLASEVSAEGHLVIGGCDAARLTSEFGTPLYVFDEFTVRSRCREIKEAFAQSYAGTRVLYAAKAFLNRALAVILMEEGLGLDVDSEGEMGIARFAGFPPDRVYFVGNNKSDNELAMALDWHIGRIVADNFHELDMLGRMTRGRGVKPDILLRLSPAVDPHTHQYVATGVLDSKFGFTMASAKEAVRQAMAVTSLNPVGMHFHLGSPVPSVGPYEEAIEVVLDLAAELRREYGFELMELDVGGGVAAQYTLDSPALPVADYARAIASKITGKCHELGLSPPQLVVEPGRAIVAQAGVALYTAGAVKDIPGVRRYVSVDGGMGDNIRTALYGSRYEAVIANKMQEEASARVTIAGRFCESGDILVRDIEMPTIAAGDIIAIPVSGAYCLPLASNYNASFRPAVVMVKEGKARLVRRRETLEDLTRCDL